MNKNPLLALKELGQHVWLDNLSRTLIEEGTLQRLIKEDGVDGVTSNPSIFEKAISSSPVSYTHLRAHETVLDLVCRLLLEKKNTNPYVSEHPL